MTTWKFLRFNHFGAASLIHFLQLGRRMLMHFSKIVTVAIVDVLLIYLFQTHTKNSLTMSLREANIEVSSATLFKLV
jgi:hypothetical protein